MLRGQSFFVACGYAPWVALESRRLHKEMTGGNFAIGDRESADIIFG
jgi:hypothetical protein